ncbi:MAG: phage portal protein [Synergistaceae bacterium]|nr:phage portal protein [Synergistaceae bacterium]
MSSIPKRKREKKSAAVSAENVSQVLTGFYGLKTAGVYVSPSTALQCSAVFACIGLLAESISQLPLKVYRFVDGDRREDRGHWAYELLARRPCSWLTSFNWRELAMMCLCLRGDFYAYKVRDNSGRVRELLPLLPGAIAVRQLDNWELQYMVTFSNGTSKTVPQSEIFHVMYRSVDGVRGLSPIACERQTIGLALAAQEHGAATFSNGAKPGGVLMLPGILKQEALERLKADWQSAYSGENAGNTAILEQGIEFKPLSMTNADAQYLETRKFQVEEIARIFGIPLFMIQSTEKTTTWGSGIEQISMGYVRYTLLAWIRRWEDAIWRDLLSETDPEVQVKFNVEGLQRGAMSSRFDAYQKGINMGVYSPNEIRKLEDMNPREGGDIYLTPMNMQIQEQGGEIIDSSKEV